MSRLLPTVDEEPRGKLVVYGTMAEMCGDQKTYTQYDRAIIRTRPEHTYAVLPETKRFGNEFSTTWRSWGEPFIDATDLPDRFNALRVYRDVLRYSERQIHMRFLGTNAAVRDLAAGRADVFAVFSRFRWFSVFQKDEAIRIRMCMFARTSNVSDEEDAHLFADHDYDDMVRAGDVSDDGDPEATDHVPGTIVWTLDRYVAEYKKFQLPWASLLLLLSFDRPVTEWNGDHIHRLIGRAKAARQAGAKWRVSRMLRVAESVRDNADGTRSIVHWSLCSLVGPARTRDALAAVLRERALRPTPERTSQVSKRRENVTCSLIEYMPPLEFEIGLCCSYISEFAGKHGPHLLERLFHHAGTPLPPTIRGLHPRMQCTDYQGKHADVPITLVESASLQALFASRAALPRWPLPHLTHIYNARPRWSYQWRTCAALAMLFARMTPNLSPYPVMWIFDWVDYEFCWCSTIKQRIELIEGVFASVKKVHKAHALSEEARRQKPSDEQTMVSGKLKIRFKMV